MRMRGVEPPRAKAHRHLKPARLPIPPHPRRGVNNIRFYLISQVFVAEFASPKTVKKTINFQIAKSKWWLSFHRAQKGSAGAII